MDNELYTARVHEYDQIINGLLKHEQNMLTLLKKDSFGTAYKKIVLIDDMIYLTTVYIAKFKLSVVLLGGKNENILNEARKTLYKPIIYLEEIVTNFIDAAYTEYEEQVNEIANITEKQRYYLIRKLGLAISLVIDAYGGNTKWRWSFVEIEGRFATVAKNIINMKEAAAILLDPRSDNYDTVVYHLRLVKKLLQQSADRYREKYEIATNVITDFKMAIQFLEAVRRMHLMLNEHREADEVKRKLEIWKEKMEKDQRQRDRTRK